MLKTIGWWVVFIVLLVYLVKNPQQVGGWIHSGFSSLTTFASSVGNGR